MAAGNSVALTLFFEESQGSREAGWSETIQTIFSTIPQAITTKLVLIAPLQKYVNLRLAMLGAGVECTYVKLTLVSGGRPSVAPTRRSVYLLDPPTPQFQGGSANTGLASLPFYNPAMAALPADFSQVAFMLRLFTSASDPLQYYRTFWITGLPDGPTQTNSLRPAAGPFLAAFDAWAEYVVGSGNFTIKVNDRSAANPPVQPTAYNAATGVYTATAHGLLSGQQVEAVGWRKLLGGPVPSGIYKVLTPDANSFVLQGTKNANSYISLGVFRPVSYVFPVLTGYVERSYTNKKRGRPFGGLVGRRKTPVTNRS